MTKPKVLVASTTPPQLGSQIANAGPKGQSHSTTLSKFYLLLALTAISARSLPPKKYIKAH